MKAKKKVQTLEGDEFNENHEGHGLCEDREGH